MPKKAQPKVRLIPFDNNIHKPRDVGLGGLSSEYTATVDGPNGEVMVIPTIWWDEKGEPKLFENVEEARALALEYEKSDKKQFPRFPAGAYEQADKWAGERSKAGGAKTPLARDIEKEQRAKVANTFVEAI
jgi:hypothetical protein